MHESDSPPPATPREDEIVRLEDLAPRRDVGGGRKITLGEPVERTPPDGPPARPEA